MSDEPTQVEIDEHIEAPPAEVFDYVTDPERRPFGLDEQLEIGTELTRERPSRVAWEVTTADRDATRRGTVEIAIAPDGDGSRVRVTHRIGEAVAQTPSAELALAA